MDIDLAPSGSAPDRIVVRFAGDSGDGMQLVGTRATLAAALGGRGISTFPDFPAEIRAPTGTTYGVSAFQLQVGTGEVRTAGDAPDLLVAMNPAALKTNLGSLARGGTLLVDVGTFSDKNLRRAGYETNPLEDGSLDSWRVIAPDLSRFTLEAVKVFAIGQKRSLQCRNMWALGLALWLLERDGVEARTWIRNRFGDSPVARANIAALEAGYAFGETTELAPLSLDSPVSAPLREAGRYRTVTGAEATALGIAAVADRSELEVVFAAYPITPASPLLHHLAAMRRDDITPFQAEDEIAAACAAIGASYGGALGVTCSSGPGITLKAEAMSLAVAVELPLVVLDFQRSGPSTGMPTKTEQADLLLALYGRHGEAPVAVLAPRSSTDCFRTMLEAARIAIRYMTPVIVLADAYLANASEPWRIPDVGGLPPIPVSFRTDPEGFQPYTRDPKTLARDWVRPGTPGLEHRVGGLEKSAGSGNISYDPANHADMTRLRKEKIERIRDELPPADADGDGPLCVVGWGSTYGALREAVERCRGEGIRVAHLHLRHLHPLPPGISDVLSGFRRILVPEMNQGQLVRVLRDACGIPAELHAGLTGKPFTVGELADAIRKHAGEIS